MFFRQIDVKACKLSQLFQDKGFVIRSNKDIAREGKERRFTAEVRIRILREANRRGKWIEERSEEKLDVSFPRRNLNMSK
jgi:hypothetical protein